MKSFCHHWFIKSGWQLLWDAGKYQKEKDLFIFGMLTSLRFSDLVSVREHHITNDNIDKKSEKTDIQQIIPLTKLSREILERYNYNLIVVINTGKFLCQIIVSFEPSNIFIIQPSY
ncbi:MAG: hypothetical protein M0Q38_17475 [Bacteroidales bacterium]|nr:hypothetical protein [Bacteroidales bacterium]